MRLRLLVAIGLSYSFVNAVGVRPAHADSITVTGGSYNGLSGAFTLEGNGFSLSAADENPRNPCGPCTPAQLNPISVNVFLAEDPFLTGVPGTFNGISYDHTYLHGTMSFAAPLINASQVSPTNLSFTVPFSMTGNMVGFSNFVDSQRYFTSGIADNAFFNGTIQGSGHVTLTLAADPPPPPGQTQLYDTGSLVYRFEQVSAAPTPEPTPILLLAGGLATVVGRRASRRARRTA